MSRTFSAFFIAMSLCSTAHGAVYNFSNVDASFSDLTCAFSVRDNKSGAKFNATIGTQRIENAKIQIPTRLCIQMMSAILNDCKSGFSAKFDVKATVTEGVLGSTAYELTDAKDVRVRSGLCD